MILSRRQARWGAVATVLVRHERINVDGGAGCTPHDEFQSGGVGERQGGRAYMPGRTPVHGNGAERSFGERAVSVPRGSTSDRR